MRPLVKTTGALFALTLAAGALAHPRGDLLRLDTDGDGMVSREEFGSRPARGPKMFERADADGDGQLVRAEVEAAVSDRAEQHREERLRHMLALFDDIDTDGNGVVTPMEIEAHTFARIDADGDGLITAEEAESMRKRFHDRGEGRRGPPRRQLSE